MMLLSHALILGLFPDPRITFATHVCVHFFAKSVSCRPAFCVPMISRATYRHSKQVWHGFRAPGYFGMYFKPSQIC